jgi:hypothetical protein
VPQQVYQLPEHRKIAILEERAVFAVKLARLI